MRLKFDIEHVTMTEFGIGHFDADDNFATVSVPVDEGVQSALREMVEATWQAMQQNTEEPAQYEPSEKHASTEYLYLLVDDPMAKLLFYLHEAANLPTNLHEVAKYPGNAALDDPSKISFYFARLTDNQRRRLTAIRRAVQYKGLLNKKNRLIRFIDDTLELVSDTVFKLDNDFDLLIDSEHLHILRPRSFEIIAQLRQVILEAVPRNIQEIQQKLPFVNLSRVEDYASSHPRAAQYLASICSQGWATNIDKDQLKSLCESTDVGIEEANGSITVTDGHVMSFLEVLDRRRYEIELVRDTPERFRAASRIKIDT